MMILGLGDLANPIGKGQRLYEIAETELTRQLHDAVDNDDTPVRDTGHHQLQVLIADLRSVRTTGFTILLAKIKHLLLRDRVYDKSKISREQQLHCSVCFAILRGSTRSRLVPCTFILVEPSH